MIQLWPEVHDSSHQGKKTVIFLKKKRLLTAVNPLFYTFSETKHTDFELGLSQTVKTAD